MKFPDKITYGELDAMDDRTLRKYTSRFGYACYLYGLRLLKQKKEAKAYYFFKKGARFGNYDCNSYLGNAYFNAKQYKEAFKYLLKSANHKYATETDLFNLGLCYFYGYGTSLYYSSAYYYFKKSFKLKNDDKVALYIVDSILIPRTTGRYLEAYQYTKKAIELNGSQAHVAYQILCYLYENGIGIEKNLRKSFEEYTNVIDSYPRISTNTYADIFTYFYEHNIDEYMKTSLSVPDTDYHNPKIVKYIYDTLVYDSQDLLRFLEDPSDPSQVLEALKDTYVHSNYALFAYTFVLHENLFFLQAPGKNKKYDADFGQVLFTFGKMYEDGTLFAKDEEEAIYYYEKGAEYGNENCREKAKAYNDAKLKAKGYQYGVGKNIVACGADELRPIILPLLEDHNADVQDKIEELFGLHSEEDVYFSIAQVLSKEAKNEKDYDLVIKYLNLAIEYNHPYARQLLLRVYEYGKKDNEKALEIANYLISQNDPDGYEFLGEYQMYNLQDYKAAKESFEIAARLGSIVAIGFLASLYFNKLVDPIPLSELVILLKKGIDANNGMCEEMLARIYENQYKELGESLDFQQVANYYIAAANKGRRYAAYKVGCFYKNGTIADIIKQDFAQAEKWLKIAADKGFLPAFKELAVLYETQKKYQEALETFIKGGKKGDSACANSVALYYDIFYKRLGIERNEEEALKWYTLAIKLGSSDAMCNLGTFYYNQKEYDKAVEWFKKSAEQGNVPALRNLTHRSFFFLPAPIKKY